jgi:hypothetical protein
VLLLLTRHFQQKDAEHSSRAAKMEAVMAEKKHRPLHENVKLDPFASAPDTYHANQSSTRQSFGPGQDYELLSEKCVARMLSVKVSKLQRDRCNGVGIPFIRIGRTIRYRLSEVLAFIDNHDLNKAERAAPQAPTSAIAVTGRNLSTVRVAR